MIRPNPLDVKGGSQEKASIMKPYRLISGRTSSVSELRYLRLTRRCLFSLSLLSYATQ